MYFQFFKDNTSKYKKESCDHPKIDSPFPVMPYAYAPQNGIPISCYNVIDRIKLKNLHQKWVSGQHINVPHNRRHPDTDLQEYADDLCQIPKNTTIALVAYTSPSVNIQRQRK